MSAAVVEPRVEAPQPASAGLNLVDHENPWLGLDSFTEETRGFFHGREQEIAELARRVQRKLLAILFGQSGLGKTSILRAGIVPRLRREGFCPVYVRIDYSRESPPPSEQIKQAIFRATEAQGQWSRPGTAVPGESLWEFLHHRDDVLRDPAGKAITPLLIFDQFEEIFTLGQDDDFGRKRAAQFIEDLADLVENRPPKSIEAMLELEETLVERFDFSRADYRVLIALREDYLAHLEGLKGKMPSITQNRMRLARMTGDQALTAVMKPGGRLVTDEVAEAIVRFIAGGAELRNAEVEPSLLSLVCRELNNARKAQGRAEISADVLAGSRDTILNEFYERALADQPAGVRDFIEDEMLTESGFRESLAEERVVKGFSAAGAPQGALATLVNRRLLRIEERLDMRRVELTHDVLCDVVQASRDLRHEREAKQDAERQLEAQKAREAATHKALLRARQVALGCAMLAIAAIGGAIFGYQNMKRAQEAEAKAQGARASAESARGEAEKLIVYLLDDFYLELEPIGRLDIVASLSKRALDYYEGLPPELRNEQTERNRALAQVRYGYVLRYQAKLDDAEKTLADAVKVLKRLRDRGDRSEATAIGLGLGLSAYARVQDSRNREKEAVSKATESAEVLGPLMTQPNPSVALRRSYGQVMNYLGFAQMRRGKEDEGVKSLGIAREAFRSIDNLKLTDFASAAAFTEATSWQMEAYARVRRQDDARRIGEETLPLARQILEKRPGHMGALRAKGLMVAELAQLESERLRLKRAITLMSEAERDWEDFLKLDPGNTIAWNNLAADRARIALWLEGTGRLNEALGVWRKAAEVERHTRISSSLAGNLAFPAARIAILESELGLRPAKGPPGDYHRLAAVAARDMPREAFLRAALQEFVARFDYITAFVTSDFAEARKLARASILRTQAVTPADTDETRSLNEGLAFLHYYTAWTSLHLKEFAEAVAEARKAVAYRKLAPPRFMWPDQLEAIRERVVLALALAREQRLAEAQALIAPELALNADLKARGGEDVNQHYLLALAQFTAALAAPDRGRVLLTQASATLDGLPPEMKRRLNVQSLRGWINEELAKRP